jgi:hypothetical protein
VRSAARSCRRADGRPAGLGCPELKSLHSWSFLFLPSFTPGSQSSPGLSALAEKGAEPPGGFDLVEAPLLLVTYSGPSPRHARRRNLLN